MTTTALAPRSSALVKADGERFTWLDILSRVGGSTREAIMRAGVAPRFEDLAGWEFGGGNAVPIFRLVGIRKFMKGFYEGPPRAAKGPEPFIQGYNIDVKNNGDDEPHIFKHGVPRRYGFYRVHRVIPGARDDKYPNALLLDYGLGGNGIFGAPLRDYLVQVYPDDPDLLLGKAYLNILGVRIPTSFFVLKRLHQHSFDGGKALP